MLGEWGLRVARVSLWVRVWSVVELIEIGNGMDLGELEQGRWSYVSYAVWGGETSLVVGMRHGVTWFAQVQVKRSRIRYHVLQSYGR